MLSCQPFDHESSRHPDCSLMQCQRALVTSSGGRAAPCPTPLVLLPAPSQLQRRCESLVVHSCQPSRFDADAPPCERRRLWQYSPASGRERQRIRRHGGDRVLLQRSPASSAWQPGDSTLHAGAYVRRVEEPSARSHHDAIVADDHVPLSCSMPTLPAGCGCRASS